MRGKNLHSCFSLVTLAVGVLLGSAVLAEAGTTKGPVKLNAVVSNWTVPLYQDFLVKTYGAENPHVALNWQGLPFRQVFESIEIQSGAKSTDLDVIGVDVPLVASYGIRGYLHPLDNYFSKEEQAKWLPEAREAGTFQGKLLAPPGRTSTQMLYYNKKLFADAKVEPPPLDPAKRWTWDQVVDAAKKLTRDTDGDGKPDVWGVMLHQISRPYQMLALPQSAGGGDGISADGLTVRGHLTNAGWIRAAKFIHDLFNTWKVAPKGVTPNETQDLFRSGRVAILITGDWGAALFKKTDFEWGVAPHPYFAGGKPVTPTGSWHWGVGAYSARKEEAARLLRFITLDSRSLGFLFEQMTSLPAHQHVLSYSPEKAASLGLRKDWYEIVQYELKNTARARPKTPGYLEWEDLLNTTFEDIRNGANPEEALRKAEGRIEGTLQKYRH